MSYCTFAPLRAEPTRVWNVMEPRTEAIYSAILVAPREGSEVRQTIVGASQFTLQLWTKKLQLIY
jgi:hypothetical protein